MCYMFNVCSSLKEINLSNFNTDNETNMGWILSECSSELRNKIKAKYKNI